MGNDRQGQSVSSPRSSTAIVGGHRDNNSAAAAWLFTASAATPTPTPSQCNMASFGRRPTSPRQGNDRSRGGGFQCDGKLDLAVANGNGNSPPSRFCWARARAVLGRRPASPRATVQNQSRCGFQWRWQTRSGVANLDKTVSILLARARQLWAKTDLGTGDAAFSVAVGDFNGDGNSIWRWANLNNTVSILLGTGTGSFGRRPTSPRATVQTQSRWGFQWRWQTRSGGGEL